MKNPTFFTIKVVSYKKLRSFNVHVNIGQTGNKSILLHFLPPCYYKTLFFTTGPCNQKNSLIFFTFAIFSVTVYNFAVMDSCLNIITIRKRAELHMK